MPCEADAPPRLTKHDEERNRGLAVMEPSCGNATASAGNQAVHGCTPKPVHGCTPKQVRGVHLSGSGVYTYAASGWTPIRLLGVHLIDAGVYTREP